MADFDELAQRVDQIERQLRGEGDEPIDVRSLPMAKLQNHLEFDWFPEASKLVEPNSVTAKEIGVLPGFRVWLNGNMPINNAAVTPVEYNNVLYDTDQMVGFNTTPAYATPYGAYFQVKTPGIYSLTTGVAWEASAITAGEYSVGIQWRSSSIAAWGTAIAEHADAWTSASTAKVAWVPWVGALAEGNQVRAYVFQSSGAGQFINSYAAAGRYVAFSGQWIGALPQTRGSQP